MGLFRSAARMAFHRAGGLRLVRYLNREGLRILMYHRFLESSAGEAAALDKQCAHLRKHYHLVSLTEVASRLQSGTPMPPNSLAITVDDGYRDFLATAFPVFSAYGIPVTVFLITDFLDRKLWLWWDQIRYIVSHAEAQSVAVLLPSGQRLEVLLESLQRRNRAAFLLEEAGKQMTDKQRLEFLGNLTRSFRMTLPSELPEAYEPLRWQEVRQLARKGVDFGAHTKTHPVLSRLAQKEELVEEVEGSKRRIEEELETPVHHFCYPYGGPEDFNTEVVEQVRRAGFQTAVTTEVGLDFCGANPFALKRIGAELSMPDLYFRRRAAGLDLFLPD